MSGRRTRTPSREYLDRGFTCVMIRRVLAEAFGNSQATMAEISGIDPTQLYRIVRGERPAGAVHIGAIVRSLSKAHADLAIALMAGWLQEIANSAQEGFTVTVEAAA